MLIKHRFTLQSRALEGILSALVLICFSMPSASDAEPLLKREIQPVIGRATPPPIPVEDYHGELQMGYERVKFIAPGGKLHWGAWINPAYLEIAQAAMALVEKTAVGNRKCNDYFALMSGGKTFDEIWHATGSMRIRISFSSGPSGIWRAATYPYAAPFEWTITETTVKLGPASVASAMVHEATRSNGVGPQWRIAYGAEAACGVRSYILNRAVMQQLGWRYWRAN